MNPTKTIKVISLLSRYFNNDIDRLQRFMTSPNPQLNNNIPFSMCMDDKEDELLEFINKAEDNYQHYRQRIINLNYIPPRYDDVYWKGQEWIDNLE